MRRGWAISCVLALAACSSPTSELAQALKQAHGWIATVQAVTTPATRSQLPPRYISDTCRLAVDGLEQAASTIAKLHIDDARKRAVLDHLEAARTHLSRVADQASRGQVDDEDQRALTDVGLRLAEEMRAAGAAR
jgi:hypothetical protein